MRGHPKSWGYLEKSWYSCLSKMLWSRISEITSSFQITLCFFFQLMSYSCNFDRFLYSRWRKKKSDAKNDWIQIANQILSNFNNCNTCNKHWNTPFSPTMQHFPLQEEYLSILSKGLQDFLQIPIIFQNFCISAERSQKNFMKKPWRSHFQK